MKKSYYERNKAYVLQRAKERYANDPEYRKKTRQRARKRYHSDKDYRLATIERAKERYRKSKPSGDETSKLSGSPNQHSSKRD